MTGQAPLRSSASPTDLASDKSKIPAFQEAPEEVHIPAAPSDVRHLTLQLTV
jgi:hypothetical protein